MDPIALLCSLHGNGTETLSRLRSAGCGSLHDVGELDPERLSGILEASPAAARRFRRQARTLEQRLGEVATEVRPRAGARPPLERSRLTGADRRLFDRVLDAWRTRDEAAAPAGERDEVDDTDALAMLIEPDPELLRLEPELAESLAQAGLATVEAIADLDEEDLLELVDSTEIAYTRLLRLRGVARRSLDEDDEGERKFSDREPTGEASLAEDVELIPQRRPR